MSDKVITQYLNKKDNTVHCYCETRKNIEEKYSYSKKNWDAIEKKQGWFEEEVKEVRESMKENDYLKITYIINNIQEALLVDYNDSKMPINQWAILKNKKYKQIFKVELINASFTKLFSYYFDSGFYKKIIEDSENQEHDKKDEEDNSFLEKYMEKTKIEIMCNKISDSLDELFVGEYEPEGDYQNASFVHPRFNLSQYEAIEKSLNNKTTIIKGPPGTGKTTTLLNIVISAFLNNKTILISSKNNAAVDNVLESLERYDFPKFWFRFGNKNVTRESLEGTLELNLNDVEIRNEYSEAENVYNSLKDLIKKFELQKITKASFKQWKSVNGHIEDIINNKKINTNFDIKTRIPKTEYNSKILNLLLWFTLRAKRRKADIQLNQIITSLYKNTNSKFKELPFDKKIKVIKSDLKLLYKLKESISILKKIDGYKTNINFNDEWNRKKENKAYYNSIITKVKYMAHQSHKQRKKVLKTINERYDQNFNLKRELEDIRFCADFIKAFPVHFVTNLSIYNLPDVKYDYVVLDEAGQSDIQSTIALMQKGKHNILCGDEKQLEPIYCTTPREDAEIAEKYNVEDFLRVTDNSLLNIYSKFLSTKRISFLDEHYRCPPNVIKFSNNMFYENKLKIMTNGDDNNESISIINVKSRLHAKKWINEEEVNAIIEDINKSDIDVKDIAIISPFRDQVNYMKKRQELKDIEIDTVFKFQGREFDRIYFSTVLGDRTSKYANDYLNKASIINVALTRAKKDFKLVTDVSKIQKTNPSSLIGKLQKYILEKKYNKSTTAITDIKKIWDENILNSDLIKKIPITSLYKKISQICSKEGLLFSLKTRMSDVFEMNIKDKHFGDVVNYVVYDETRKVILAISEDKIIYKKGDAFNSLELAMDIYSYNVKSFITSNESEFKDTLEQITKKNQIIFSSVKLAEVINLDEYNNLSEWIKNRASLMHFDYVIYEISNDTLTPIKVIELDDISHLKKSSIERDEIKDWVSSVAKIKVKRFISYKYQ